jgi:hypothetical protein
MLGRARERTAANPSLAARVGFVEGEAESLPFADGEFDHLTFTYLLRYVEDPACRRWAASSRAAGTRRVAFSAPASRASTAPTPCSGRSGSGKRPGSNGSSSGG